MTETKYVTSQDGIQLAYTDEGEGLPVIALSGLTRTGRDFDFIAPHLKDVRLIRPDYRGRGQSDWAGWETYIVPQEAGDVLHLMDELGLERAAFLGTSRGGLISMAIAAGQPERVIGVCLNDVGPVLEKSGIENIDRYIGVRPKAKTMEEAAAGRAATAVGFANVPPSRWMEDVERMFVQKPDGVDLNYDPALREGFLLAARAPAPDLWPLFGLLKGKPVTLIHGLNSDLLSAQTVKDMQAAFPEMVYAAVPDRGHMPWLDEAEAVAAVTAWLDRCR